MNASCLHIGDIVDVRAEAGQIVIRPVHERAYDIKRLIKAITDENMHQAVDFGPVVGRLRARSPDRRRLRESYPHLFL